MKRKFDALGMEISDDMFDRFINLFTSSESEYKINIIPFVELIYHFNSKPKRSLDEFKHKHLDIIREQINDGLTRYRLSFADAFNKLANNDRGTCQRIELQQVLVNRLDIKNTTNLKILFNHLKDGLGEVNLARLEHFLSEVMRTSLVKSQLMDGIRPIE